MDPQKDVAKLTKEKERTELRSHIIDTARIVCGAGSVKRSSVRPSVCPIDRQQQRRAAGLLVERCEDRRYRSIAGAGAQRQRRRSTALGVKCR